MNLTPFENVLDNFYGKVGTPKRDEHEKKVEEALHAYHINSKVVLDALSNIPKNVQMQVDLSMSLSDRIANLMKAQGLNKKDFSKQLGISENKLTSILSGTHDFTLSMISKLSDALGEKLIAVK